ncbi:ABC transporter substrate-binding protein [Hymenobacter latericus]|uniref:ABC transporter substrate-binding protein n=1 Tax=Hymenobacter sp. YIM 151858-1 TaxID=2987688 RepID=UPI0022275BE6|nr:ABC transporter substrate-binding protein [Hymenobacter sp. YIM 151858-1]UYZ59423.1 ABC transporter substrate-binding protein [Hymenobacter sp. YIM 151858-1]
MRYLYLLLLGASMAACSQASDSANATKVEAPLPARITVTDDLGRAVSIPSRPKRVMALAASMTEMLFAVADTGTIIARTQACDYPAAALRKPKVNSYPVDFETIVGLHPDVVFTVEGMTSAADAARLQQLGVPVYYQRYRHVADILRGLRDLGRLLGREPQAKHLTDSLRRELASLPVTNGSKPRTLAITWLDPIYAYGRNTLFTDKIRLAGGQNALQDSFPQPYPALTREYILKLNPDVLIGGRFGKLDSTFFRMYPELRRIRAYQTRQVYPVDGDLMARPSPRIIQSVRELHRLLHPTT